MARKEELGTKKSSTLLKELAIPAIFAMLVSLLYNMVDRIYIGNMPNGTLGMAGLSIAVPVITMIQAFTMMFGAQLFLGIHYTRRKGRKRVQDEILLVFACMNLKKMAL